MDFTLTGTDPRFLPLKRRLEADGHRLSPDSGHIIAPPAERRGIPYYKDEVFIIENAALTAEGAVALLMRRSDRAVMGMRVLVAGYGRIGSLLAGMLSSLGADVTVCARSPAARATARAFGYRAVDFGRLDATYDAVINTVPARVLAGDYGGAVCIDLASAPGGWAVGEDGAVIRAPGLPGLYAPRAAADAMAEAIYRAMEVITDE